MDNIIVLIYLLAILLIGLYNRSHLDGLKSYSTIKNGIGKNRLLLVATIFASSVGGGTTFGIAEKAFAADISYTYGLILTIPIDILIAIYVLPRLLKHYGSQTVGDIMAKYYGNVGRFITGIVVVISCIGFAAAQISVSGRIFQYILDIDYVKGIIISYVIVIIYTTIGGLKSIIFTNLLQFFAMIIAIPTITIFGIKNIGLWEFTQHLPPEKALFTADNNLLGNTIACFLGFSVMNLYPTFIQRALINRDHNATRRAIYIKSVILAIFLVFITLNGLISYHLYPDSEPGLALPRLIDYIIPTGIKGLVVVGLLSAVMSTADSDLNVSSTTIVKDLLNPILKVKSQTKLLFIAQSANIIIGSFAIIIALGFSSVIDLVIFIAGFWGAIILVPLTFALFDITIPKFMMVLSGISGGIAFLGWEYQWHQHFVYYADLKSVFVGTMVSLAVFIVCYITSKAYRSVSL